jgi:7-carboxy-7-deazaguanine synthase
MNIEEVLWKIQSYPSRLVEITGGEPLEQEEAYPLMESLLARGYAVMLETGGHVNIGRVPKQVIKVIDIKCPESREGDTVCWENLGLAQPHDEFKLVIRSRADYDWAKKMYLERLSGTPNPVLFSPSHDELPAIELARWILDDGLAVRLQLQVHKYIWGAHARGV